MSEIEMTHWLEVLRSFNARNVSRAMDVDVMTSVFGAQSEVRGMALRGVAYDHHDESVQIMLGEEARTHLTHSIQNITEIDMLTGDSPRQDVLRIKYADGQVILTAAQVRSVPGVDACDMCGRPGT